MKSSADGRNWGRHNNIYTTVFDRLHGLQSKATCRGSSKCPNQDYSYLAMYQKEYHIQIKGIGEACECNYAESNAKNSLIRCTFQYVVISQHKWVL